ncbi:MAG: hypothetical protein JST26_05245 [Bacteroidetes bacterium]|nr:hypothetical protein [Bacteroidota bacterium]
MGNKIIGSFVFEDIGNGCLSGRWHNNSERKTYPESAKLTSNRGALPFEGIYKTTWIQEHDKTESCELIISLFHNEIYNVTWQRSNSIEYQGQAMIYKGMLVGHFYQ